MRSKKEEDESRECVGVCVRVYACVCRVYGCVLPVSLYVGRFPKEIKRDDAVRSERERRQAIRSLRAAERVGERSASEQDRETRAGQGQWHKSERERKREKEKDKQRVVKRCECGREGKREGRNAQDGVRE